MEKIKYPVFILVIALGLFFFFGYDALPENIQFQEIINSHPDEDVIIIFNSGGWGDTPPGKAEDLDPIVKGIQKILSERGYQSVVVPYERTKKGFLAKIRGLREMLGLFQRQSDELAYQIKIFLKNNPGKTVIMVGLSNGASFVDETIKKIDNFQDSVLAIEIGPIFYQKRINSENILYLDNRSQDSLARGKVQSMLPVIISALPKWFFSKISGTDLSISDAFTFSGHKYSWESLGVDLPITSFLDNNMGAPNF